MTLTKAIAVLNGMPDASVFHNIFEQNNSQLSAQALKLMASMARQANDALLGLGLDTRQTAPVLEMAAAASIEAEHGSDAALIAGLCEDAALAYAGLLTQCRTFGSRIGAALKA